MKLLSLGHRNRKSFLAVSVGVLMLMEKKIEELSARPAVEAGEKLGFTW